MEQLASELERLNPNKNALASPLINAKWRLLYTTSASILGSNKPPFLRPQGPIYQTIDAISLIAKNEESWPFFNQVRFSRWQMYGPLATRKMALLHAIQTEQQHFGCNDSNDTSLIHNMYLGPCTSISQSGEQCHTERL